MKRRVFGYAFLFGAMTVVSGAAEVTIIADRELTVSRYWGENLESEIVCNMERKVDGKVCYHYMQGKQYDDYTLSAPEFADYRFCGWRGMVADDTDPYGANTSLGQCTVLLTDSQTNRLITAAEIDKATSSAYHENEHVICPTYERTVTIAAGVSPSGAGTAAYATDDPRFREDGKTRVGVKARLSASAGSGYAFADWRNDATAVSSEANYEFTTAESAGGTYVAVFTGVIYKVTFNRQDGEGGADSVEAQYQEPMPPLAVKDLPERYGYDFGGYFSETDGKGSQYYTSDGKSARVWDKAGNVTLYAKWIPKMANFNLEFNTGVEKICYRLGESSLWVTNEAKTTIQLQVGTRVHAYGIPYRGYAIDDYHIERQWVEEILADGITFAPKASAQAPKYTVTFVDPIRPDAKWLAVVEEGQAAKAPAWERIGYGLGWDRDFSSVTEDMTVTAVWTPNPYVIRFESNGGSGEMPDLPAAYDTPIALTPNAFANGILTFQHWTATVDRVAMNFANGETVSNLTSVANGTNTLYAVWGEDYLVGFDGNGATSGEMSEQHFVRGERKPLDANAYARTGYAFLGWQDTAAPDFYTNCQEVADIAAAGTTNVLVAAWSNNPYRVEYDMGSVAITGAPPVPKDCAYDKAWRLAPAPTPKQSEFNFVGWGYAFGEAFVTNAPGASVSNLTTVADQVVVVQAIWREDFGGFSRALGGDALRLKFVTDDGEADWYVGEKTPDGDSPSSSYVGKKETKPTNRLCAEVYQSGTLSFRWKGPGNDLTVCQYLDDDPTELKKLTDASEWEHVSVRLIIDPTAAGTTSVALLSDAAENDGWPIWIADMTWMPDGDEPQYADVDTPVAGFVRTGGKLEFSFTATSGVSYHLLGTNDLVSPMPWPKVLEIPTGTSSFEIPVPETEPKMFYRIRALKQ